LKRQIGSPQDYLKNRESNRFPDNYDLRIPVEETQQRKTLSGPGDSLDEDDFRDALGSMDVKSPINGGAQNLAQKRVSNG
jgi:hypothetical protein